MEPAEILKTLVELPWASLLTLACGYTGYFVAHVGVRSHHRTVDVVFATFVFGFLAAFVYQVFLRLEWTVLPASAAAFVAAIVLGGIWNAAGRSWFYGALRHTGTTDNDDLPSAWAALFAERGTTVSQVTVKLVDGTWLKCDRVAQFEMSPNGPLVFGGQGDLLMYVTHQQGPNDDAFEPCVDVTNADWGDEITYIPKEQIVRVDIRKKLR
jgi:hypothetical protein